MTGVRGDSIYQALWGCYNFSVPVVIALLVNSKHPEIAPQHPGIQGTPMRGLEAFLFNS